MYTEQEVWDAHARRRSGPQPGETWRHHKGDDYRIVLRSVDEATLGQLVTYQSVKKPDMVWTRTLEDFVAPVTTEVTRFRRISYEELVQEAARRGFNST